MAELSRRLIREELQLFTVSLYNQSKSVKSLKNDAFKRKNELNLLVKKNEFDKCTEVVAASEQLRIKCEILKQE